MKTLKKTLCLVLAVVMAVGVLVIPANAATSFPDDADITHDEAVAVLSGLGILGGDDKGNFNPDTVLKRAEAAKIINYLAQTPAVAKDYVGSTEAFTDVPADHWAINDISYCVANGIIGGNGDGTFKPSDTLTGHAFAKMLLCALGYDGETEGFGTAEWKTKVDVLARRVGLVKGISSFNFAADLSRDNAAQMAYNALTIETVHYTGGTDITIGDTTIKQGQTVEGNKATLAAQYGLDAEDAKGNYILNSVTGVITANAANNKNGTKTTIGDTEYTGETGLDVLYRYVKAYVDSDKNIIAVMPLSTDVVVSKATTDTASWDKAFGTGVKVHKNDTVADVAGDEVTITEGTVAPAGTYVVYDKTIYAYIKVDNYTLTKVSNVINTAGKETITLPVVGTLILISNKK